MIEITMPRLSDTMEEGSIAAWQVRPGDHVSPGDVLAEIETDKAVMDFEAYDSGTITELLVEPGSAVSIGQPIALLDDGVAGPAALRPGDAVASRPGSDASRAKSGADQLGAGGDQLGAGRDQPSAGAGPLSAGADRLKTRAEPKRADAPACGNRDDRYEAAAGTPDNHSPHAPPISHVLASPLVRRIARDHDLDLRRITGSGPGGRIIRRDVERALAERNRSQATAPSQASRGELVRGSVETGAHPGAEAPGAIETSGAAEAPGAAPAPGPAEAPGAIETSSAAQAPGPAGRSVAGGGSGSGGEDPRRPIETPVGQLRRVIARRLTESARDTPVFTVTQAVRVDALLELRAQANRQLSATGSGKMSVNDMVVKAAALALRSHSAVNSSWGGDHIATHGRVNVGIAVATERGLMVPVIMDADVKTVAQLGAEARSLAELAAQAKLAPEQMSGGTFTVSNLGMYGVDQFTAIINPPEAAILAVGTAQAELALDGANVVSRQVMRLTASFDHRVIDGAQGARFLVAIRTLLENPWSLLV
ncbi:MAG: 2-oxo acid dehydrogenase subunit E2 [Bifidobacteriaceae bacterium]|jgi:pyruvate dehydrogenase E2 component (dihydrolipoamide acetyltransferase)|nr:2-oxo acid dehydrogenase subunit E2 [Bifidobacteriaceae bacterium]